MSNKIIILNEVQIVKKKFDIKYSTKAQMEHPIWAKPYVKGKLKTFFVPSVRYGREIVEFIQRMDIDYETVTIDRSWDLNKWGFGDFYDKRGAIWDFDIMYQNLENVLCSDEEFDVLVLPGINGWGYFTEKTLEAIKNRVKKGEGLILVHPYKGKGCESVEVLDKLSPLRSLYEEGFNERGYPDMDLSQLKTDKWIPKDHYINHGIPFDLISFEELGYYPYEASGEVILESQSGMPIAAVKEYGEGRIVAFGYYPKDILPEYYQGVDGSGFGSSFDSIISGSKQANRDIQYDYMEYFYGLLFRSMIWASKNEAECNITNTFIKDEKLLIQLSEHSKAYDFHYRLKNLYDETVLEGQEKAAEIVLPEFLKLGGQFRMDVFLKDNGKILDWATISLEYPLVSRIKSVMTSSENIKQGDELSVVLETECQNGEATVKVIDDFGRIIHMEKYEVKGNNTIHFNYLVGNIRSLNVQVQAELEVDGYLIQRLVSNKILVTSLNRKVEDFEIFMTPLHRGRNDFMNFLGGLFRGMGVTGLFPGDTKTVTRSGASGLGIYWYHRAPYVERKENYLRTKDKKYLCRVPCLNNEEFWAKNGKDITKAVKENKKYAPISYFANDEGSLTSYTDELELCFCHHCMSKMREWLKGEYKSLEELNGKWNTNFQGWDQVIPYTSEEAKIAGKFASWGDHRRFMEFTFANSYKRIRDYIRIEDPEGVVRMSGCQASTPYSGYDYYQLHQYVGYFEAYGTGNQWEFHRSFAKPDTIIGGWTGYGASGINAKHSVWSALYHGLTLMSIFWQYACLNPDFTYSKSAMDLGEVFKEIRQEGIGKLLLYHTKRDDLGIAIHYSMTSIHGSYIRMDEDRFKNDRQGWLDLLEDLGYQYSFVATQQIEAGELISKGYKVLILPYSIGISGKEKEEIERFVAGGGTVIGDFQTGIMDEHCCLYEKGILDDVFGIDRLTNEAISFFGNREFVRKKNFPYFDFGLEDNSEFRITEPGIRATTGLPSYVDNFMEKAATVVVNEVGEGKGIYLNFSMDHYPLAREKQNGGYYTRELIKKILPLTSVEKFAKILDMDDKEIEKGYETIYYSDNNAKYVGIIADFDNQLKEGHDGLAVGSGAETQTVLEDILLRFVEKAHIYDVRDKKYLGFTDRIHTSVAAGDTKLFSLLPYQVDGIQIDMGDQFYRGGNLNFHIEVKTDKPHHEYFNIISINIYNTYNEREWVYCDNISIDETSLMKSYPIPYNEQTGKWRIVVKDVATGVLKEKTFYILEN